MTGRAWTSSELRTLRRLYPVLGPHDTAAAIGRTVKAVSSRAKVLHIQVEGCRRFWTTEELDFVRANYRQLTAKQIGAQLGRSVSSVYQGAEKLGLVIARPPLDREARLASLRQLHAQGYSDSEIAREWGISRKVAEDWRKRAGLPSNALSEHRRARVREKTREQLARAGLPSLAHVRLAAFKKFARKHGWPEDLRPRAVMMLNAMWQRGPMTRRELADAIGMPWKGSRKSLVSNDPEGSYLAHLMKRGLVVSLGRCKQNGGQGKNTHVYTLALDVQRGKVG
jgi:transposase-like protein